jgi:tRNA modification GTPase
MDTIFALATSRGKAGIAVFRVSGPAAHEVIRTLCGDLPPFRRASLRKLRADGQIIDEALVLTFAEGSSFTGEAMAELHTHGSAAVIESLARLLGAMPGLRQAEPGEFTRRALEAGLLDINQVEGLADLIDAETESQRRQAMQILSGAVGAKADLWRVNIIRAAALIEATIDFADEDVPIDVTPEVRELLTTVLADLRFEARGSIAAERVRDGFEVAIVGPPNVGKSTLLNMLAGRQAAITSARAGTTRDVIEVRMNLSGLPVTLLDTAGLRSSDDEIESIGIDLGRKRAEAADLRVFLVDMDRKVMFLEPQPEDIVLLAKADLRPADHEAVSGMTGAGVDRLIDRLVATLQARVSGAGVMSRERHRVALSQAIGAIETALDELTHINGRSELVAAEIRVAAKSLDQLVGRIDVENLLDEIFASFCIGK